MKAFKVSVKNHSLSDINIDNAQQAMLYLNACFLGAIYIPLYRFMIFYNIECEPLTKDTFSIVGFDDIVYGDAVILFINEQTIQEPDMSSEQLLTLIQFHNTKLPRSEFQRISIKDLMEINISNN